MSRDHKNYEYLTPVNIGVEFAVPKNKTLNLWGLNPPGYITGQDKQQIIKYTPEEVQILGKGGLTKPIHLIKSIFGGEIIEHEKIEKPDRVKELYR